MNRDNWIRYGIQEIHDERERFREERDRLRARVEKLTQNRDMWRERAYKFSAEQAQQIERHVRAEEREACAQVCEQISTSSRAATYRKCADAIRARGNNEETT